MGWLPLVLCTVLTTSALAGPLGANNPLFRWVLPKLPLEDDRPSFCKGYDCPKFKVIETKDEYQVREYEPSYWINTTIDGNRFEIALAKAKYNLRTYFNGENEAGDEMNMTVPLVARFKPDADFTKVDRDFVFGMYLPDNEQNDPPKPTLQGVYVCRLPRTTMYTRVFGGMPMEGGILKEGKALKEALDKDKADYVGEAFWYAVYDPIYKLTNRHNEVAYFKASKDLVKDDSGIGTCGGAT